MSCCFRPEDELFPPIPMYGYFPGEYKRPSYDELVARGACEVSRAIQNAPEGATITVVKHPQGYGRVLTLTVKSELP